MLGDELARKPYVKSDHNASLVAQTGRTRGSVEFKYQNISAVLERMGLPWIFGFNPRAIIRTLSSMRSTATSRAV